MRKCKIPNCQIHVDKPKSGAAKNSMNEVDYTDDASWEFVYSRPAHRRPQSARETEVNSQIIADRVDVFELWGDSDTRQTLSTYRIRYTDIDSVEHRMGIIGVQVSDDNFEVKFIAVEDLSR